jgi:NAD(P)-dependent dehydrogenase (short-subunit alcohol dehydrogenase family)
MEKGMLEARSMDRLTDQRAYVVTGPTSGIGRETALGLAKHGTVVLVGLDAQTLAEIRKAIERKGQRVAAVSVTCPILRACGARLRRSEPPAKRRQS